VPKRAYARCLAVLSRTSMVPLGFVGRCGDPTPCPVMTFPADGCRQRQSLQQWCWCSAAWESLKQPQLCGAKAAVSTGGQVSNLERHRPAPPAAAVAALLPQHPQLPPVHTQRSCLLKSPRPAWLAGYYTRHSRESTTASNRSRKTAKASTDNTTPHQPRALVWVMRWQQGGAVRNLGLYLEKAKGGRVAN